MENIKSNPIHNFVNKVNNSKDETENHNRHTEIVEIEIEKKINKFKERFKKLGEQLQSETLIKYINEDEELNKLVYKVYSILKVVEYKKQT
jgi:hypothetical protein